MADPNDAEFRDDHTDEERQQEDEDGTDDDGASVESSDDDDMPVEFYFPWQPMALWFGFSLLAVGVLDRETGAVLLGSLVCVCLVAINVYGVWYLRGKGASVPSLVLIETVSLSFLVFCVLPWEASLLLLLPVLLGSVFLILVAVSAPVNYFKAKMLTLQREDEDSPSPRLVGMLNKVSTYVLYLVALLHVLGCTYGAVMFARESMIYHEYYQSWYYQSVGCLIAVGFFGLCSVFYLFAMIHWSFASRRSDNSFERNELEVPLLPAEDTDPAPGFANSDLRARTRDVLQIV